MAHTVWYEATATAPRIGVSGSVVKQIGILFATPEAAIADARDRMKKFHAKTGGDMPLIGFDLSKTVYTTRDLWLPEQ